MTVWPQAAATCRSENACRHFRRHDPRFTLGCRSGAAHLALANATVVCCFSARQHPPASPSTSFLQGQIATSNFMQTKVG
jgi:hypothetical protein